MFSKLISIILLVFLLSGFVQADLESDKAAYETAVKHISPLAEAGDAKAQGLLGVMYRDGIGVPQDYAEALKWTRKAVAQGDALAQSNLGVMYENGQGVPQDYTEALKWYRKAAAQGHALAQGNLGAMYSKGLGVPQDDAKALKWYRKAAEQGNALAQGLLGVMYADGIGVQQDYTEALKWLRKAAEQSNESAMNNLAWILATSPDKKIRDGLEAVKFAELIPEVHNHAARLDTLAAAYAEVGRFKDAVETQKKVLSMMEKDDPQLAKFQLRLSSYQKNKPWREN